MYSFQYLQQLVLKGQINIEAVILNLNINIQNKKIIKNYFKNYFQLKFSWSLFNDL